MWDTSSLRRQGEGKARAWAKRGKSVDLWLADLPSLTLLNTPDAHTFFTQFILALCKVHVYISLVEVLLLIYVFSTLVALDLSLIVMSLRMMYRMAHFSVLLLVCDYSETPRYGHPEVRTSCLIGTLCIVLMQYCFTPQIRTPLSSGHSF